MDELKLIFASNLIRLRTAAGMTQAVSYTHPEPTRQRT